MKQNKEGPAANAERGAPWVAPEALEDKLSLLPGLVPVYQKAFAGEPWFEVSQCGGCARGYSGQSPGEHCADCGTMLTEEAYPVATLLPDLESRVRASPSVVYTEADTKGRPLLGAIGCRGNPTDFYQSKYLKNDRGSIETEALFKSLPDTIVWVDEIFADRDRRASGNLWNFGPMCELMAARLETEVIAFRTINKKLMAKAQSVFGSRCSITEVPDRGMSQGTSSFVIINIG